jgi:glyoxylase-like metal-dependent hydrolase (beta-lactamase superfamily II)
MHQDRVRTQLPRKESLAGERVNRACQAHNERNRILRAERAPLENSSKARRGARLQHEPGSPLITVDEACGENVRMPQRGPLCGGAQQPGTAVRLGPSPSGLDLRHEDTGEVPNSDTICPLNEPGGVALPRGDEPRAGRVTPVLGAENTESGDPFAPATAAGIHRIAIPTPFAVGRVNVYLIEDEPLTLVDAGPNSGTSLDELQRGIEALGHSLEDIQLVILTHQHIDHLGLVSLVAARSGAEVAALDVAVRFVENFSAEAQADDDFATEMMLRHGIPEDVVTALGSVSRAFRAWGSRAKVDRVLRDEQELPFRDRTLAVHHRPGHSPTDTIFHDRERKILIAADHLLGHISSNPLLTRPTDGSTDRPQALVQYLASLEKTREMEVDLVLPGHGDPITDHRSLIDERFTLHRRRADKIHRLIAERPRSAYEIAQTLWGNIAVTQAYLTLSEVLGHVDLLINDGRVQEVEREGVAVFAAR